MDSTPAKDFGPIAGDYEFFETHATEAENDARAYVKRLGEGFASGGPIRMLDFGCGSGSFTERFLKLVNWPPTRLELTLVEPVEAARRQAVGRLGAFSDAPISNFAALPSVLDGRFHLVLANHVFYYVPELREQLDGLIDSLTRDGVFLTAIAGRTNALIKIWIAAFGSLGRPVPYHTSEDVNAALTELGTDFDTQRVPYELTFDDNPENRLRIIRFLLAEHLSEMRLEPLLSMFDRYSHAGRIEIRTGSDHYAVRAR
jgi:trans-aconitate 2-methyltransferase